MTNEEWKIVEKRLSGFYGHVRLKIDGYNVSIDKSGSGSCSFAVFINGKFDPQWTMKDCDIRRRFCRKVKGGEFANEYEPFFGSFRTLKSQLIKNNSSIELAEDERL